MAARIVGEDPATGVWVVALRGPLSIAEAARGRLVVDKCLAQCPAAIVMDLRGLTVSDGAALSALPVWQRRADEVGVPLVYVADEDVTTRIRRGAVLYFVRVQPTMARARAWVLRQPGRRWLRLRLSANQEAGGLARQGIGDACLDWGVLRVLHRAGRVVAALVDDTVHSAAGADVEVTAGILGSNLHIRVRGGGPAACHAPASGEPRSAFREPRSPSRESRSAFRESRSAFREPPFGEPPFREPGPPVPGPRDRTLRVLDRYATAWGAVRESGGRTVWATLRVCPPAGGAPASGGRGR